jgi:NTP pyrophosphatase (non-canonical NTP hydrolase)
MRLSENKMINDELDEFIEYEYERLVDIYNVKNRDDALFPMTIKIMEELGELSEEVLASKSLQRPDKLKNRKSKIEEEFADVILTTLLLARNMNVDMKSAIKNKIEKIKKRKY